MLLYLGKIELALGVFSGLSTLSAGIAGFWFGNRSTGYPESLHSPGGSAEGASVSTGSFDPMMGNARRPVDSSQIERPAMFPSEVEQPGDKARKVSK